MLSNILLVVGISMVVWMIGKLFGMVEEINGCVTRLQEAMQSEVTDRLRPMWSDLQELDARVDLDIRGCKPRWSR